MIDKIMGKASNWLNKLLRRKRPPSGTPPTDVPAAENKGQRLGADGVGRGENGVNVDPSKGGAIAVAEAAIAAAKAAAEVVRMSSGSAGRGRLAAAAAAAVVAAGGGGSSSVSVGVSGRKRSSEDSAAVKLQSAFRGYLARRALKALKGLVKLQALVRGYLVRKQSADMLRCMQAMVRLQARARANRVQTKEFMHFRLENPNEYKLHQHNTGVDLSFMLKRCGISSTKGEARVVEETLSGSNWLENLMGSSRSSQGSMKINLINNDENADKILEVDSWKPRLKPSRSRNRTRISNIDCNDHSFAASDTIATYFMNNLEKPSASPFSDLEVSSIRSLNFPPETWTSESSPQAYPLHSRHGSGSRNSRGDESSTSFINSYHPNYMSNTRSYRAKIRCQSAPRQRPELEKPHSIKRSGYAFQDQTAYIRRSSDQDAVSARKLYLDSGRVDRLVNPIQGDAMGYRYY